MALHPDFPDSPHAVLDLDIRWFPADEALRETTMEKLMPPLVPQLRRKVKEFRDSGYASASETSRSLLTWWFAEPHLLPSASFPSHLGRGENSRNSGPGIISLETKRSLCKTTLAASSKTKRCLRNNRKG